jgi:hypothetical protein
VNTSVITPDGWESWSPEVVRPEVTSFEGRANALTGLSEAELKSRLGPPGEQTSGTRWESASGEIILQADRDLRYFSILPHVVVSFAIANGFVARVAYLPKWRRCPSEIASNLSDSYAPK